MRYFSSVTSSQLKKEISHIDGSNKYKEANRNFKKSVKINVNSIQDKAGNCLTEEKEIRNMWTEYFSKLYNHPDQVDSEIFVGTSLGKEDDFPILREEVEAAIRSLKNGKASGIDKVPTELIKEGGSITIDMLMKICNKIWQAGQWPSTWTQSLIITLPKKGTLQHCQNYCTIVLQSPQ